MIRAATLTDAKAISEIYNYYITNSLVSFEKEEISESEMEKRMKKVMANYPFLVYEVEQKILGYAYASRWKIRAAYDATVESSIYLSQKAIGRGIGSKLYQYLINDLKQKNIHCIIGGVALPNDASVRLHEKLGFKKIAHFKEVGYKFDRWIDVAYWQLITKKL